MASIQRREREKDAFRNEVLAAARAIVLRDGFDGLTMRKIAQAIEYAPGTIYLYFPNRDAIATELTQLGFSDLLEALSPAAAVGDPIERLRALAERYVRFALENPETYRLVFMERYAASVFKNAAPGNAGERALSLIAGSFDELKAAGRLRSGLDRLRLVDLFWAAVHGIASLKITCEGFPVSTADDLVAGAVDVLLYGILTA